TPDRQEIRRGAESEVDVLAAVEGGHFAAVDGPHAGRAALDVEPHAPAADVSANDAAPRYPPRIAVDVVLDAARPRGFDENGHAIHAPSTAMARDRRVLVPWQIDATPEDRLAF